MYKRICFFIIFCLCTPIFAAEQMLLWQGGAPKALGTEDKDIPLLYLYPADKDNNTGAAVVVCPGGGYGHLAMDHEGHDVARWLNSIGVSAFVLKYRLGSNGYKHPVPMLDAKRAVRSVRYSADKWNIDPARIGIMGFSAGGHLASTVGTHFDYGDKDAADPIDKISSRPDFMILMYPVITLMDYSTHKGSRSNLLGENPDTELIKKLSNHLQVTDKTPPTILIHADDDKVVFPDNSVNFYLALRKAKVPAELHIYKKGGHGFGIGRDVGPASAWPSQCQQWLKQMELLER
ncbi:MAG: alpha/beta hydrolase [Sedimentisphaerales bacterium]|nr:alpha/beta hydrolase [Sedimentisphaerales bacterium]